MNKIMDKILIFKRKNKIYAVYKFVKNEASDKQQQQKNKCFTNVICLRKTHICT